MRSFDTDRVSRGQQIIEIVLAFFIHSLTSSFNKGSKENHANACEKTRKKVRLSCEKLQRRALFCLLEWVESRPRLYCKQTMVTGCDGGT